MGPGPLSDFEAQGGKSYCTGSRGRTERLPRSSLEQRECQCSASPSSLGPLPRALSICPPVGQNLPTGRRGWGPSTHVVTDSEMNGSDNARYRGPLERGTARSPQPLTGTRPVDQAIEPLDPRRAVRQPQARRQTVEREQPPCLLGNRRCSGCRSRRALLQWPRMRVSLRTPELSMHPEIRFQGPKRRRPEGEEGPDEWLQTPVRPCQSP